MFVQKYPLGLAIGLVGILAVELAAGPFLVPQGRPDAADVNVVRGDSLQEAPISSPPITDFAEVVMRPLFAPSRRPYAPRDQKLPGDETKPETFALIGVIISPIGRVALLRPRANNDILRVVEGQSIAGWEVRTIKTTEVVLVRGSADEVLKLDNSDSRAPETAPPGLGEELLPHEQRNQNPDSTTTRIDD